MIVFGLGKDLLSKSVLGRCEVTAQIRLEKNMDFFFCFNYLKKKLEIKIQLHSLKLQAQAKKTEICNINNRRNMFGHYTMHILKTAADD